jgi:hypothetical protein
MRSSSKVVFRSVVNDGDLSDDKLNEKNDLLENIKDLKLQFYSGLK